MIGLLQRPSKILGRKSRRQLIRNNMKCLFFFAAVVLCYLRTVTTRTVSLDDRAADYCRDLESSTGHKIRWYDMYLKQSHLRERSQYHKYKITISASNIRYGDVIHSVSKPGFVYNRWYHNGGTVHSTEHTFTKTTEITETYEWSKTDTFTAGYSVSVTAGIPEVFGATAELSTELSLSNTQTNTETSKRKYSITDKVMVPPQKSVEARFTVTELEMDVPWEADINISGWIAIWFEEKYNGHWLWFHPISYLANNDFSRSGSGLRFTDRGKFHGVRGAHSSFRVYEHELQEKRAAALETSDQSE